jgi:hypothetical protein
VSAADGIVLRVASGPLADAVVRRVVGAVGAQAELPIDRLQDAGLVTDAILDHLDGDQVQIRLGTGTQGLELAVGPLAGGEADQIIDRSRMPDLGSIIERLADRVWIERSDPDEFLCVEVRRTAQG